MAIGTKMRLNKGKLSCGSTACFNPGANFCTTSGEVIEVNKIIRIAALNSSGLNRPICIPITRVGMVTAAWACDKPYTVQNSFFV